MKTKFTLEEIKEATRIVNCTTMRQAILLGIETLEIHQQEADRVGNVGASWRYGSEIASLKRELQHV